MSYDTGHVFARLFGGSLDLEPEDQEAENLRAAQRRAKEEGADPPKEEEPDDLG